MATIALRPAERADVGTIARIWGEGWADAHLGNVPDALVVARTPRWFSQNARDRLADTTVAQLGDSVVGFVIVDRDQVDHLYLGRAARGAGVGRLGRGRLPSVRQRSSANLNTGVCTSARVRP